MSFPAVYGEHPHRQQQHQPHYGDQYSNSQHSQQYSQQRSEVSSRRSPVREVPFRAGDPNSPQLVAFRKACQQGHIATVRDLAAIEGFPTDSPQEDGCTGMWLASEAGHPSVVEFLCQRGASPSSIKTHGRVSALYVAAQNGQFDVVNILLQHGADPNFAKESGATPLFISSQQNNPTIVSMLLAAGAMPNKATNAGVTPIMIASYQGNADVVALLLANGADPEQRGAGKTAAEWAASNNTLHLIEGVLRQGQRGPQSVARNPPHTPTHLGSTPGVYSSNPSQERRMEPPMPPSRSSSHPISVTPHSDVGGVGGVPRRTVGSIGPPRNGHNPAPSPINVNYPPAAAAAAAAVAPNNQVILAAEDAVYETQRGPPFDDSAFSDGLEAVDAASFQPSRAYTAAEASLSSLFKIKDTPIDLQTHVDRELSHSRSRSRSRSPMAGRKAKGSARRAPGRSASPGSTRRGGARVDLLAAADSCEPEFVRRERMHQERFKDVQRSEARKKKHTRPVGYLEEQRGSPDRSIENQWGDYKYRLSTMENELVKTRYDVPDKWMFSDAELHRRAQQKDVETTFDRDVMTDFPHPGVVSNETSPERRQREYDESRRAVIHPSSLPVQRNLRRVEQLAGIMGVSDVEAAKKHVSEIAHLANTTPAAHDSSGVQKQLDLSGLSQPSLGDAPNLTSGDTSLPPAPTADSAADEPAYVATPSATPQGTPAASKPPSVAGGASRPVSVSGSVPPPPPSGMGSRRTSVVSGAPSAKDDLSSTLQKLEEDGEYVFPPRFGLHDRKKMRK